MVGGGSPVKKLGGGARGMAGAAADRRCGVVSGGWAGRGRRGLAVRPVVAGGSGGVEFDDKLEALDFVSNGWKI